MPTLRRYIHLLVRIARCVVYPEFRGLGLGQVLVKHAAEFARRRWQVSSLKPYFLEISADMLKYVPFAEKSGMTFVGETQGNLGRVAKDIGYLLKNQERIQSDHVVKNKVFGILDKQRARMKQAVALMERTGWNSEQLVMHLDKSPTSTVLRDFDLLREIISLPKPTYLQGLNPEAAKFVKERASSLANRDGGRSLNLSLEPLGEPLAIERVSLSYESRVRRTSRTHAVEQAFGISPECIAHDVVSDLSLNVKPGEVVLLTGTSGSGKSTLLRLLAQVGGVNLSGVIRWSSNYRPGTFTPIRSQKALIEVLDERDVSKALSLMGRVGLSDAYVFLKRFDELSSGQQYRAMLAKLVAGNCNVWLADEFCANLDSVTANIVADRMQRTARELGATLIVASSQPETFVAALQPDQVVRLTTAREHQVLKGPVFLHTLRQRGVDFSVPILGLSHEYFHLVRSGIKGTTIRKGRLSLRNDLLILSAKTDFELVSVTGVRRTRLSKLTAEDAKNDGFESMADLRRVLLKYYPSLGPNSWVTVVEFELLGGNKRPFWVPSAV
jgi:ABC-type ATPase with predicted acetyltransferase domain